MKAKYFVFPILMILLLLAAIGCSDEPKSVEEKMATIDRNYSDKVKLARYQYLIRMLEAKTGATSTEIGNMTANAKEILKEKYGKDIKLLDLLEGVNQSIPSDQKVDYRQAITLYVSLIGQ